MTGDLRLLDHLSEVAAVRGPRRQRSLTVSAYLVSITGSVATIKLWGSDPIPVPAIPGQYDGIRTVWVAVEDGRPTLVYGPTTATPPTNPQADPAPDPQAGDLSVVSTVVTPTWSGTYQATRNDYGSYGYSTPGYPYSLMQGSRGGSGALTGIATYGNKVKGLSAIEITKAVLVLVSAHWEDFTPVIQGAAQASKPSGAPTLVGSAQTGPLLPDGKVRELALDSSIREDLRTGSARSLCTVGGQHGAVRGRGHPQGMVLKLTLRKAS